MKLSLSVLALMLLTLPVMAQGEHLLQDFATIKTPVSEAKKTIEDEGAKQLNKTFHGHPCTKDCSGHKAGYAWAEKKGIETVEGCGGKSNSFTEGCQVYAKQQEAANNLNE